MTKKKLTKKKQDAPKVPPELCASPFRVETIGKCHRIVYHNPQASYACYPEIVLEPEDVLSANLGEASMEAIAEAFNRWYNRHFTEWDSNEIETFFDLGGGDW